MASHSSVNGSP
ncbi:hypothetical protein VCCP10303_3851, partial [Vibrio cholerae CP1030(3)]